MWGTVTALLCLINILPQAQGSSWKDVFAENQRWHGYYYYGTQKYKCSMSIYHVEKEGLGTVYAGFTDPDTSIELEGGHLLNAPNFTIQFSKATVYMATSNRIPPNGEFEITGKLVQSTTGWNYHAHITKPIKNLFSNFTLTTLEDTERMYTVIVQNIVGQYGKTFTMDIKVKQMGRKEPEAAKIVIDTLDLPLTVDQYLQMAHEQQEKLFPTVNLLPGAERLVKHLRNHGIPIATATGSHTQSFQLKTSSHKDLFSLFHHSVLSGDDPECKHGKPAPDCFLLAAQRFPDNPHPSKVLVFEDAPNGVEAAHAAGMQCVWIPLKEINKQTHQHMATLVLDSLEEFKPEMFGLPPFDN
ncbi:pseudouridine-5'-phosphatase-like [Ostrea edulis]|uniref:pseudouridine-5'-phosphatase-like n=1 Tax=Ostrea edulis TaxID=37623 RepID=UPI0020965FDA|nr:pseudouridine-5'-phosphatase-like [Ostrea edulis]XP_056005291.1 pseudouridine-5'-phosphatase-like [Ostrea edulis]